MSEAEEKAQQVERVRQVGKEFTRLLFQISRENGYSAASHETTLAVQKVQEAVMWGREAIEGA